MCLEFHPVDPGELDPEDCRHLCQALCSESGGVKLRDVVGLARRGRATVWRFRRGAARGIVVTQVLSSPVGGRELYIWLLGGEGVFRHLECIDTRLAAYAEIHSCRALRAEAVPRLARIYQNRRGYLPASVSLVKPLAADASERWIGTPPQAGDEAVRLPLGDLRRGRLFRIWVPTRRAAVLAVEVPADAPGPPALAGPAPAGVILRRPRPRCLELELSTGAGPAWVSIALPVEGPCRARLEQCGRAWDDTRERRLIPWNFWYWPYSDHTPWPARAAAVVERWVHRRPDSSRRAAAAARWERRHHCIRGGRPWEGHCRMAAAASVLFLPPPRRHAEFRRPELQLLAAELAGNYAGIAHRWHLSRGRAPGARLRHAPPAYVRPGALDVSAQTLARALAPETPRGIDPRLAARHLLATHGGREVFEARLTRWLGELAAEFYDFLATHLGEAGHPLVADLRGYRAHQGPEEVHNHAIHAYRAHFTEQPGQGDDARFRMRIDCRITANDGAGRSQAPALYDHTWELVFSRSGDPLVDHPDNRWAGLRNDRGEELYAPAEAAVLAPLAAARRPRAEGNPALTWKCVAGLPVLKPRTRYAPAT